MEDKELREIFENMFSELNLDIDMDMPAVETTLAKIEAKIVEARIEQKIDTLKIAHGHQQTGTILNDEYFIHNITMLERELKKEKH